MKINMLPKQAAFTMIELMVTLTILGIMLALAAPSFQTLVKNNRIAAETNRLVVDMQFARSEALKRGASVIMCRSGNPAAATPGCGGAPNTWSSGWLVYASGDANKTYEVATDTLLRVAQASPGGLTIKANGASNSDLEFKGDSSTNQGGGTARFAICDDRGNAHGRMIEIPPVGKPRRAAAVPSCAGPP